MAPLRARFIVSGTYNGHVCHVFLAPDLAQVAATADLMAETRPGASAHDPAAERFQVVVKPSKRIPPSGILLLVRDGRPAEYESAPLALVQRSVRCSAVRELQLAFGEEQRLAEALVDFPIGDQRRAAMKTLMELRGSANGSDVSSGAGDNVGDGRLEQICAGALAQ